MPRTSIFRGKNKADRVQGILTKQGLQAFERSRRDLAKLTGWKVELVSDGDVMEFNARGLENTKRYLAQQQA